MSGALAERVFAKKIQQAGLVDLVLSDHEPMGVDDVALYPLFTPAVIQLMRDVIGDGRQHRVATRVLARARKQA